MTWRKVLTLMSAILCAASPGVCEQTTDYVDRPLDEIVKSVAAKIGCNLQFSAWPDNDKICTVHLRWENPLEALQQLEMQTGLRPAMAFGDPSLSFPGYSSIEGGKTYSGREAALLELALTSPQRFTLLYRFAHRAVFFSDKNRAGYYLQQGWGWCGNSYSGTPGDFIPVETFQLTLDAIQRDGWWSDAPNILESGQDWDPSIPALFSGHYVYLNRPRDDSTMATVLARLATVLRPQDRYLAEVWKSAPLKSSE